MPNVVTPAQRAPGSLSSRLDVSPSRLLIVRLGTIGYQDAWDLQRELTHARGQDRIPDVLLLLQHPHTYTLGRRGREENILLSQDELRSRGIALYRVDRGGDVTYHGPGQLVGYPIMKLPGRRLDYVRYVRDLEAALLATVQDLSVEAQVQEGFSGVWVGNEKVCAIGVKVDAIGVTSHGFALNVNTDLSLFQHMIPCGLVGKGVTSLNVLLRRQVSVARVERIVIAHFAEKFGCFPAAATRRALIRQAGAEMPSLGIARASG